MNSDFNHLNNNIIFVLFEESIMPTIVQIVLCLESSPSYSKPVLASECMDYSVPCFANTVNSA